MSLKKREILLAFGVTRLALVVAAVIALATLPGITGPEYRHVSDQPLIDLWYRWDAGYFTRIAQHGYGWMQGARSSDVTFLPLYPGLMSLPLRLIPTPDTASAVIVGVLLSNACLLLALSVFDRLLRLDNVPVRQRRLALWLVVLSPATIFFSGVYTESLFWLLSLMAIYNARRQRWLIASLAAFLAAGTRVIGWIIVVPLLAEAWQQRTHAHHPIGPLLAAASPLAALPIYAAVVGITLHSPFAFFEITQAVWGQGVGAPWQAIASFISGPITLYGWQRSLIDVVFTLIGLALVVPAYRQRRSYGLYQLAAVLFPVLAGTFVSMPRYAAVAFPGYLVVAGWAGERRYRAIGLLALSGLTALFVAARFVTWRWIA